MVAKYIRQAVTLAPTQIARAIGQAKPYPPKSPLGIYGPVVFVVQGHKATAKSWQLPKTKPGQLARLFACPLPNCGRTAAIMAYSCLSYGRNVPSYIFVMLMALGQVGLDRSFLICDLRLWIFATDLLDTEHFTNDHLTFAFVFKKLYNGV